MQKERLVVLADYVCPFCCLADHVLRRLPAEVRVQVDGAAFELRPAGTPLPDLSVPARREAWRRLVEPIAEELDVPLSPATVATRTRKAHEAASYARSVGRFDAMHEAIYAAYWQQGRDIGRIDVLVEIGRAVGLDATALRVALDIDQWTERVEADEMWARQLRVEAVPAYVRTRVQPDGMAVAADIRVGLQRLGELRVWMEREQ